ncbi:MAG: hydrogenase/urease maturation nickel metallochaperone HypA, partial [Acidimicrobiales bacterium]
RCRSCGEATEDEERIVACVACGSLEVETTGGDELTLESLEYRP